MTNYEEHQFFSFSTRRTETNERVANRNMINKGTYTFFYKQPHFPVEPRVAIGSAQNEAKNCLEVANVFWRL